MSNGGVAFCDLPDIAPERFSHDAKMALDLFRLLGIHGACIA